jgi:purine-binding chemotaxis protein CheW
MMSTVSVAPSRPAMQEVLVFRIGEVVFGLDIVQVQEINRNIEVTRVYSAPAYVRGVINLRGQIVTIIDLAHRLNVGVEARAERPKNIIVESRGELVGILVDEIEDIVQASAADLLPLPPHIPKGIGAAAVGVLPLPGSLVVVLDVDAAAG